MVESTLWQNTWSVGSIALVKLPMIALPHQYTEPVVVRMVYEPWRVAMSYPPVNLVDLVTNVTGT